MGLLLTFKDNKNVKITCAVLMSLLALGALIYALLVCPFSRRIENWLLDATLVSIVASAAAYAFAYINEEAPEKSKAVDYLMWLTVVVCCLLAAYSLLITFSVFSAVLCPPLDETNLLEKLCNTEVTLSDHDYGWAVPMMGYNKFGGQDYRADAMGSGVSVYPTQEFPSLEFSLEDFSKACRSGSLKAPVACVYAPSHDDPRGYRHFNLYERYATGQLAAFLREDGATYDTANQVASNIARQVEGNDRNVGIFTVAPSGSRNPNYNRSPCGI